jgi:type IV pilus assembly protein PilA
MISAIQKSMVAKRNALAEDNEKGFTLIELLVVVLIIGILAAIAIPVFLSQREGAWESQVKSDIANAVIAAETYSTNNNGTYAGLGEPELEAAGYKASNSVALTVTSADASGYVFTVTHTDYTGQTWTYTSSTGETVKAATASE